jgi:hypothetical protein
MKQGRNDVAANMKMVSLPLHEGSGSLERCSVHSSCSRRPLIGLTLLNPVDLARVMLLLQFDTAALMGYTGAVFERFFGTLFGIAIAGGALLLWTLAPLALALARFRTKDF